MLPGGFLPWHLSDTKGTHLLYLLSDSFIFGKLGNSYLSPSCYKQSLLG